MLDKFEVTAYYYNLDGIPCRRCMEIKRKGVAVDENDLNVIMMNPGSSDKGKYISNDLNKFVESNSDATQTQIASVMDRCNLNYAKIVNLSDCREPSSRIFYKELRTTLKDKPHSVFHESNKPFLNNYLNPKAIFILAWGVNSALQPLAQQAMQRLRELWGDNLKMVFEESESKTKSDLAYKHPFQRLEDSRTKWVDTITEKIESEVRML